jgi:cyanophycin synthetase
VAVLNADDALVAQMAELCDGEVIFFTRDVQQQVVVEHLAQGGRAVVLSADEIAFVTGTEQAMITKLTAIPLLGADNQGAQLDNVLAAMGAVWALGVPPALIRAGVETFAVKRVDGLV